MSLNEIYNLIIASVPAISAIATVLILALKVISSLRELRQSVHKDNSDSQAIIRDLKLRNDALQDQVRITNKQVKEMSRNVQKVIDRIDDTEGPIADEKK